MATLTVTNNPLNLDVSFQTNPIVIATQTTLTNAPTNIGGIPISISNPQAYDVLALNANANTWVNNPQVEITDGGNF